MFHLVVFTCYHVCSSQRQHQLKSRLVVVLRGAGSGGDDSRTDLLLEAILRSAPSRVELTVESCGNILNLVISDETPGG